ncbi:MAG: SDR family NAD(P)-dependent oxidoreductase [Pseudomonadota bacterium]
MNYEAFRGKSVVITGASAGVGADVARAFAEHGARLMLVARRKEPLKQIAAELESKTDVCLMSLDVADIAGCSDLIKKAQYEYGGLNVLVNNAGAHHRGDLMGIDADDLGQMIDVNLRAPIVLSRLAIPAIKESGGGAIVNVASIAGCTPVPGAATYSASKFGLRAFTLALAEELRGTNVHVGAVSPGPIDTGFIMDSIDEVTDLTFSQPMSTAEEVADAVLRVAAGESVDIKMPKSSGVLATIGYVFPSISRALRPRLKKRGAKAKAMYKKRNAARQ